MSAIRFLTALAKSVHSKLFSDDSTLKQVTSMPHAWPLQTSQIHPCLGLVVHSGQYSQSSPARICAACVC